jgi:hypothetical protein
MFDSLWKRNGRWKALAAISGVCEVSEYYMNKEFVHAKNERLYCSIKKDTIANQIYHVVIGEKKKKKLVKFFICFHMLSKGIPMTNYESMSKLLHFLDVRDFPKTH